MYKTVSNKIGSPAKGDHDMKITTVKVIKAAIYARRSTDDDRTTLDGRSVDRQVELARAFCARQGWVVAEKYVLAEERSGADFTRIGLVRLLEGVHVRPRPFDVVVTMSIDRLGRDMFRTGAVVQQLHAAGIEVWCYQTGQRVGFGTPTEKLMLGVGTYAAEEYRYAIKLKTTEALRAKAARGHQAAGKTFGYDLVRVGDHTEREVNEEQAAVVRRIFEMSAAGHGDNRILNRLSEENVPAPGRGWAKTTIRRILRNELYRGVATYGKTASVEDGGRGRRVRVADESLWTVAQVPHLRIVSDAMWEKVQARKERTRAHYLRAPDGKLMGKPESGLVATRLLNGILSCPSCGGGMNYMGGGKRNRYYCLNRNRRGPSACANGHGVPMREIDDAVLEELRDVLMNRQDVVAEMCEARVARLRAEQDAQRKPSTEKEVARLEAEIGRLVNALATGKASADVTAAVNERRAKIEQLKQASSSETVKFDRAEFYAGIKTLGGAWSATPLVSHRSPALVRQVLRRLGVDKVVAHRSKLGAWTFESAFDAGRLLPVAYTPTLQTRRARRS